MPNTRFVTKKSTNDQSQARTQLISTPSPHLNNRADLSACETGYGGNGRLPAVRVYMTPRDGELWTRVMFEDEVPEDEHQKREATVKDLADMYKKLGDLLRSLEPSEESENLLKNIALEGFLILQKIFSSREIQRLQELASKFKSQESALGDDIYDPYLSPIRIIVRAKSGITLPWEFLYLEDPRDESDEIHSIDERLFLGYSAFIQQVITPSKSLTIELRPLKESGIRIFVDDRLDVAKRDEAPGIKDIFNSAGLNSNICDPLNPENGGNQFIKELRSKPTSLIHFACHSKNNGEEGRTFLRIKNDYHITEKELRDSNLSCAERPIVFFNSCEMAVLHPERYCQFLNYFFERGVSSIIATEIEINDKLAWTFAKIVYEQFISGSSRSLMHSVFVARRRMLMEQGLIVGFTYSFYGVTDLTVTSEAA